MRKLFSFVILFALLAAYSFAPDRARAQGLDGYGGGFKIYLSKDSTTFVRLLFWNQIWLRYMQQNPGTSVTNNPETRETFDIGIRRSRMLVHGQLTPRILLFWIIGINNHRSIKAGWELPQVQTAQRTANVNRHLCMTHGRNLNGAANYLSARDF
jgi:hypothetical protein